MFQIVRHPVAVANARDILKKHAVHITHTNNECGVAVVLEQLLSHRSASATSSSRDASTASSSFDK